MAIQVEVLYTGNASSALAAAQQVQAANDQIVSTASELGTLDEGYAAAAAAAAGYAEGTTALAGAVERLASTIEGLQGALEGITTASEEVSAVSSASARSLSEQATAANEAGFSFEQLSAKMGSMYAIDVEMQYAASAMEDSLYGISQGSSQASDAMEAQAAAADAMDASMAAATAAYQAAGAAAEEWYQIQTAALAELELEAQITETWAQTLRDAGAAAEAAAAATQILTGAQEELTATQMLASEGATKLKETTAEMDAENATAAEGSTLLSGRLLLLLGAYAAFSAVKVPIEFQASMELVQGMAGVSADEMQRLNQQVLDLAVNTGAGPTQLAQALYYIKSSGFDAAQSMTILTQATEDSLSSQSAAAPIADALTSAIRAYGQAATSVTADSDTLMETVVQGKMQFADLASVLGRVLPLAGELGIPLDQVGASIAEMTQKGLSAQEATTALRGAIQELEAPSKQTTAALKALGLTADDVRSSIQDKGLLQTISDLVHLSGGNLDELHGLFPNIRSLIGVLSDVGKSGSDYANVLAAIDAANGRSAASFQTYEETAKAALDHLKTDVSVGIIEVGTAAGGALKPVIEGVDGLGKAIDSALTHSPELRSLVGVLVDLAGAAVGITIAAQAFGMMEKALSGGAIASAAGDVGKLVVLMSGTQGWIAMQAGAEGAIGALGALEAAEVGVEATTIATAAATTALGAVFSPLGVAIGLAALGFITYHNMMGTAIEDTKAYKDGVQQVKDLVSSTSQLPLTAIPGVDSQQTVLDQTLADAKSSYTDIAAEITRITTQMNEIKVLGNQAPGMQGLSNDQAWQIYDKDTQYLKTLNAEEAKYKGNIDQATDAEKALGAQIDKRYYNQQTQSDANQRSQAADYGPRVDAGAQSAAVGSTLALNAALSEDITPTGLLKAEQAMDDLRTKADMALFSVKMVQLASTNDTTGKADQLAADKTVYDGLQRQIDTYTALDNAKGIDSAKDKEIIALKAQQAKAYADVILPQQQEVETLAEGDAAINKVLDDYEKGSITYGQAVSDINKVVGAHDALKTTTLAGIQAQHDFDAAIAAGGGRAEDAANGISHAEHGVAMFGSTSTTSSTEAIKAFDAIAVSSSVISTSVGTTVANAQDALAKLPPGALDTAQAIDRTISDLSAAHPDMGGYAESMQASGLAAAQATRSAIEATLAGITAKATVTILTNNIVQTQTSGGGFFSPQAGVTTGAAPQGPPIPTSNGSGGFTDTTVNGLMNRVSDGELATSALNQRMDAVEKGPPDPYAPPAQPKIPTTPAPKAPPKAPAAKGKAAPKPSAGTSAKSGAATSAAKAVAAAKAEAKADVQGLKDGLDQALADFDAIMHPDGKNALVARLMQDLTDPTNQGGIADAAAALFKSALSSGGASAAANANGIVDAWWSAVSKGVTDPAQIAALQAKRDAMLEALQADVPNLTSIATDTASIDAAAAAITDLFDPNSITAKRDQMVKGVEAGADPMTILDTMFGTTDGHLSAAQAAQLPKIIAEAQKAILADPTLSGDQQTAATANLASTVAQITPDITLVGNASKASSAVDTAISGARQTITDAGSNKGGANAEALGNAVGAAILAQNWGEAERLLRSDPANLPDVAQAAKRYIIQNEQDATAQANDLTALAFDTSSASQATAPNLPTDSTGTSQFSLGYKQGSTTGKPSPNYDQLVVDAANFVLAGNLAAAAKLIASTGEDSDKVGQLVVKKVQEYRQKGNTAAAAADNDTTWQTLGSLAGMDVFGTKKQTGVSADQQAFRDQQNAELKVLGDQQSLGSNQTMMASLEKELAQAVADGNQQEIDDLNAILASLGQTIASGTETLHADQIVLAEASRAANAIAEKNLEAQQKAIADAAKAQEKLAQANAGDGALAIIRAGMEYGQRRERDVWQEMVFSLNHIKTSSEETALALQKGQAVYMDSGLLVGQILRGASNRVALQSNLF